MTFKFHLAGVVLEYSNASYYTACRSHLHTQHLLKAAKFKAIYLLPATGDFGLKFNGFLGKTQGY